MRHAGAGLLLVALVWVVYGSAIGHDFVFDDWSLVVQNPVVRESPTEAMEVFAHRADGTSYRPVRIVSYMVDHWVGGGLDPAVFHASNLIYHAVAVLILYALAWRMIGSLGGALLAAALFAVHPLGSEAVAYVAGRRDILAGLFSLAALLAWWGLCHPERARFGLAGRIALVAWMVLAAGMALGAKESAAVFPALAALLFVVDVRRTGRSLRPPVAVVAVAGLAAVVLCLVVDSFYLQAVAKAVERLQGEPLAPQPALTLTVLGTYGLLALWPLGLSADYRPPAWPLPEAALDGPAALFGLALVGAACLGVWLTWRGRVAGVGLLWFLVALLPVSQIVPYREILAEHNAYLALAGLALVAGDLAAHLAQRKPAPTWAVGAFVVAVLAVLTWDRTADWKDDATLWEATLYSTPESVRARHNLAIVSARRGGIERARQLLNEALELAPDDPTVVLSLASIEERSGDQVAALALAKRAVEIQEDAKTLSFLGWAYLAAGRSARAAKAFERALSQDPGYSSAQDGLEALRDRAQRRTVGRRQ